MLAVLAWTVLLAPANGPLDSVTAFSFETTPETKAAILYYSHCLSPPGVITRFPVSGTAEAEARARIAACSKAREWALTAGISAYRPERDGDPDAGHFMNTSLDQIDRGFLANARYEDNLISGKATPPTSQDGTIIPEAPGRSIHDQ